LQTASLPDRSEQSIHKLSHTPMPIALLAIPGFLNGALSVISAIDFMQLIAVERSTNTRQICSGSITDMTKACD